MTTELVDVLMPPHFRKSGINKSLEQAWNDEDWIGTFNLWILRRVDNSILYQMRSAKSSWEPNKLDVSAGGHYSSGETIEDGIREVKEELGKSFDFQDFTKMGRRLNVSVDEKGRRRNNVVDILFAVDDTPLKQFVLEENEVTALFACPIDKLVEVHANPSASFLSEGVDNKGNEVTIEVSHNSFPFNWDDYHFKISLLAKKFLDGEQNLIY